jgi:undecaprenyl-diphosphatase
MVALVAAVLSSSRYIEALRGFIRRRLDPNAYLGLYATIGIALLWVMVWAFRELLDAVLDQEAIVHLDEAAAQWMHLHSTPTGDRLFAILTHLGSPVAWLIFIVVALLLVRLRRTMLLIAWLVANLGGKVVVETLKSTVQRTRPIYGAEYLHGHSYSFPSAHAMNSVIVYMMLAFVVVHLLGLTGVRRALVYFGAVVIILGVGFSRVYLGMHYPSDVIGGFVAGAACVTTCLTGYAIARRRIAGARDERVSARSQPA